LPVIEDALPEALAEGATAARVVEPDEEAEADVGAGAVAGAGLPPRSQPLMHIYINAIRRRPFAEPEIDMERSIRRGPARRSTT